MDTEDKEPKDKQQTENLSMDKAWRSVIVKKVEQETVEEQRM